MKTDGTNLVRIFKGYSFDIHVIGNWIYFINFSDHGKLYKMDVNGENTEILCDKEIEDFAIYDDKIFYSYEYNEENYLQTMTLNGDYKKFLANIKTRNMLIDNEYIYYLQTDDDKLRRMNLENKFIDKLSDEKILKFCKDEKWIFYTIASSSDSNWRFKGIYRMDLDGSNVLVLDNDVYLEEIGIGITKDWIFYMPANQSDFPVIKSMSKDGVTVEYDNK